MDKYNCKEYCSKWLDCIENKKQKNEENNVYWPLFQITPPKINQKIITIRDDNCQTIFDNWVKCHENNLKNFNK